MGIEKIYSELEKLENGKDLVGELKLHLKKLNDEAAEYRTELKKFKADVTRLKDLESKVLQLKEKGIDIDDESFLDKFRNDNKGKSELEQKLDILTKKHEQILKEMEEERKKREEAERQKELALVKSEIAPDITKVFGKLTGQMLIDKMINENRIKKDETGKYVVELETGIYDKATAIEKLKELYPEEVKSNYKGTGNITKTTNNNIKIDELLNKPTTELFKLGIEERMGKNG